MISKITWDDKCFYMDGAPVPLISGEFHYFRIPKKDWRERLILLKESGANVAATYVPWIIHEPIEGNILFDDIPERSLTAFLELCCELDIMVIIRPGPYCYSELCRDGIPFWMYDTYPETLAVDAFGKYSKETLNASYLHPVFLDRARKYIREVDKLIKPYLSTNGGCIISVQADNEIAGCQLWRNFVDCNPETMGFGKDDGLFVRFMTDRYKDISVINRRYGTSYSSFCEISPYKNTPAPETLEGYRFVRDYRLFYKHYLEVYIKTLCSWFAEDGIDVGYCTNAGSVSLLPYMRDIPKQNAAHHFLLGGDNYYSLGPDAGISMTPEKTVKCAMMLDMLKSLKMPPSVLEMQSGSFSCYPPILSENVYGFYMTHVAYGMKGSNYYVFTGGPNFENTGSNTEIYDYHAPVSATGEIRPMYYAQKERNNFSKINSWLLGVDREYDLQVGFNWEIDESSRYIWKRRSDKGINARQYYSELLLAVGLDARLFKCVELLDELDISKPLIAVSDECMSIEKQTALANFVSAGGRLILTPTVPLYDEDMYPCTILKDLLGVTHVDAVDSAEPLTLCTGEKVFGASSISHGGIGGEILCRSADGRSVAEYKRIGKGEVILLGAHFRYSQFCQIDMLSLCLDRLKCEKRILTNSRNIMATLYENTDRAILFLINNLTGEITANYTVVTGKDRYSFENITVPAMSVLPIEL